MKLRLRVKGIVNEPSGLGYLLVMKDLGNRKLVIPIGAFEAQSIAIALEGFNPPRPLTHDTALNMLIENGILMSEIHINDFVGGVFFTDILLKNGSKEVKIDSRTSDAVSLALRSGCPIYIEDTIMDRALEDDKYAEAINDNDDDQELEVDPKDYAKQSDDRLSELLEKAIAEEDYENATLIRDEINKRK